MKKILALALATALAAGSLAVVPASAYTDSSLGSKYIGKVGSTTKTVTKGSEFELEVRKGTKVKDSNIKWTIGNTSIVKFDDDDRYDDEIELKALKEGTTKVTANNLLTGGKIVYTVNVKSPQKAMYLTGSKSRTVTVGGELELEVRTVGLKDKEVKWTIADTKILAFEDGDRYGSDVELIAKKAGTTKVTVQNLHSGAKGTYTVTVKSPQKGMYLTGSKSKTVRVGGELELEVRTVGLKDSQVKWTIEDTSILAFEDGERYGSDVELIAKKAGTTKVYVKNLYSGVQGVYTVTVR